MSTSKPVTEISEAELDALIVRVQEAIEHQLALSVEDLQLLLKALLTLARLHEHLAENDITLHKLRKLAGIVSSSEKYQDLVAGTETKKPPRRRKRPKKKTRKKVNPVVHQQCTHSLEGLEKGQRCPECQRGKLYKYDPVSLLHISGQTPLLCTEHLLERLRCNTCGAYFTAPVPEIVTQDGPLAQPYGYSARALMAIQKYFGGLPFYRQETLQELFGFPVTASTVFDQCEQLANDVQPVVQCLIQQAADATHYHLDDTTNRILNQTTVMKPDRKTGKTKTRSGIYTSGVIATLQEEHHGILFQTNIGHAGEWIDEILTGRDANAPPPIIMCDALSRNFPTLPVYHSSLCNAHARREFVEVMTHFPDQVTWVLERYGLIWEHDDYCKAHQLNAQQRLLYHQTHSLPVMEQLREWGQQQLDSDIVEANSGLGKAIGYFLRHYQALTAFCRILGAKIDNNEMEATLKLIIRGRKNSLFFKTLAGAAIADVLMSLIATCHNAGINAFDYLIVLQRHASAVKQNPEHWLPWNYSQTLEALDKAA